MLSMLSWTVKMAWERLLVLFMAVAAVTRLVDPRVSLRIVSSTVDTGSSVRPGMTTPLEKETTHVNSALWYRWPVSGLT